MANITCPNDCSSPLPGVEFNECAPVINASEIEAIYIAKPNASAIDDWTDSTGWVDRISMDGKDTDAIRKLIVIGDKPAASANELQISNGRTATGRKTHTINFDVDETNDKNYEFLRNTECSGQYKIWYETKAGYLYGGNSGIKASIRINDVLNRGNDSIELFQGVVTWASKHHPERTLSPMAK